MMKINTKNEVLNKGQKENSTNKKSKQKQEINEETTTATKYYKT